MGYLDDYRNRVTAYATSPRDSMVKTYEKFIDDNFTSSPSYRQGDLNGSPIDFQLVSGKNGKNQYGEKEFLFRPNQSIERGDYITLNTDTWIVIDKNYENDISPKASVTLCNDALKWKDRIGTVFSYPCSTIPYRAIRAIQSDSYSLNMPEGHVFLIVQSNADTRSVFLKQRFILGSQVYEISGVDDSNYVYKGKGYLYFTMSITTRDGFNDDFANQIADNSALYTGSVPQSSTIGSTGNNTTQSSGGVKSW